MLLSEQIRKLIEQCESRRESIEDHRESVSLELVINRLKFEEVHLSIIETRLREN